MMTIALNTPDNTGSGDSTTTSSTVTYETSATVSSATTYYEYVLSLDNVKNPADAAKRSKTSGLDVEKGKESTKSNIIWYSYESYTTKFCMALLYAKADTAGTGSDLFTRAYGVYSSNWIGFKTYLKRLYVLDHQMRNTRGRLQVIAGLQSREFYLATGVNAKEAENSPVLIDKLTFGIPSSTQAYLEFGPDNTNNVLNTNDFMTAFRIKFDATEAGIKLIDWGTMTQEPEDDYGFIPMTFVYINDAYRENCDACVDYRVVPTTKIKTYEIKNGTTYMPIKLNLDTPPASDLAVSFSITYEDPELPQLANYVEIKPAVLQYSAWKNQDEFNVTVNNWDFAKGTIFYVNYQFSGTDAPAYKTNSNNQITFTVVSTSNYLPNPIVTVTADNISVKKYSFDDVVAYGSGEGKIYALTLPKEITPPATGLTLVSYALTHQTNARNSGFRALQGADENATGDAYDDSEYEKQINAKYSNHLQKYYYLQGPHFVYNELDDIIIRQRNGLYANTEYKVYVTFEDYFTNNSLIAYYSPIVTFALLTSPLPKDAFTTASVSGESKPAGQVLVDSKKAMSKALKVSEKMLKIVKVSQRSQIIRARALATSLWDIVFQVMADASGEVTVDP